MEPQVDMNVAGQKDEKYKVDIHNLEVYGLDGE